MLALAAILKNEKQIDRFTTVDSAISYAILCCMQAKHDAIDSIVLYLHEKIDELNERYTAFVIATYVQDYDHFLKEVAEVDRLITTSRGERENRVDLYEKIFKEHLPKLMDFLERIRSAETKINEAITKEIEAQKAEHDRHEKIENNLTDLLTTANAEKSRNRRYFRISMAFNVVLLILALAAFIPSLLPSAPTKVSPSHAASNPSTVLKPGDVKRHRQPPSTAPR